jgi:hypothetical protein
MPEPKALKFDVLCDECSRLFKEPWDSEYTQNIAGLKMDFFKKPYHTIASLRRAATYGCHLCSIFDAGSKEYSNRTNYSEDQKLMATMTCPRFHPDDEEDWALGVGSGSEEIGRLQLIPMEGF